jgi:hypothetical protein
MTIVLKKGAHTSPEEGMSLLEAVAFTAGEKFTIRPKCTSPVLATYGRELNDDLPDEQRQQLIPLIPKLIGTVNPEQDQRDGLRCAHWLVTHWLPTWLCLVPELAIHATTLRALPAPKSWLDLEDWITVLAAEQSVAKSTSGIYEWYVGHTAGPRTAGYPAGAAAVQATFEQATVLDLVKDVRAAAFALSSLAVQFTLSSLAVEIALPSLLYPTANQLQQDSIALLIELAEGRHK